MSKEEGKVVSVLTAKCPQCRKGKLFKTPLYSAKFTDMYENCEVCGLRFQREPGFFYGAMYISYAMVVALVIVSGFTLYFFLGDPGLMIYGITITVLILGLLPIIFRYSRTLYLYWFGGVKYKPQYQK